MVARLPKLISAVLQFVQSLTPMLPVVEKIVAGVVVPTPTLPVLVSTYRSSVLTAKSPVVDRATFRFWPAKGVMVRAPEEESPVPMYKFPEVSTKETLVPL